MNCWPAVGGPVERSDSKPRAAVALPVVIVIAEPVRASFRENTNVARTDESSRGFQESRAPFVHEVHLVAVEVRSGDLFAPADADFVRAVGAATTASPIHKQIVVFPALHETSSLD